MNPGITFGLMLIGSLLYVGGIFSLFYYTYSFFERENWLPFNNKSNL
jgi:hypothetical protein